jgi:hypothetical protein
MPHRLPTMRSILLPVALGFVFGLVLGLLYGWVVRPVEYVDTAPDTLHPEYRTDFVLMVAETYAADRDLGRAQIRLASLGPQAPLESVESSILYAVERGFSPSDLSTLNRLAIDLRSLATPAAAP